MLKLNSGHMNRRGLIKSGLASAAVVSGLSFTRRAHAQSGVIKIGFVSPKTGPLAGFAESDEYILSGVNAAFGEGITIDGTTYGVEVIVKDSQSNPNRAADVAAELILDDEVNLIVVSSTPETTNPVSDQCEINGVPCISTVAPWQPWFFTRGGNPEVGFDYTYHFFWGLEDVISVFLEMWGQIDSSKVVGGLFPNDGDGNAWGHPDLGFPKPLSANGYSLIDPGRYQNLSDDFTAQISAFKNGGADIVTGVMIPPDFTTFWTQARQQGFAPKIVSTGKATLFPVSVEALGDAGHNLSSEVWWTPNHPFSSSINGQSSAQVASGYTQATGRQWTQPIGFAHALFEVAANALSRSGDPTDYDRVRDALAETKMETLVGPVNFSNGPVPNVSKTPLVGGQWRLGGDFKYDMVVTANGGLPSVPLGGTMEAIS